MSVAGLIVRDSDARYERTRRRLDAALAERCIKPMARIDHGRLAEAAGLTLGRMLLLIFGNPAAGTQLMQAAPSIGIDLPLKLLMWEAEGVTHIAYDDPTWLAKRHGIAETLPVLDAMRALLEDLVGAAAGAPASW